MLERNEFEVTGRVSKVTPKTTQNGKHFVEMVIASEQKGKDGKVTNNPVMVVGWGYFVDVAPMLADKRVLAIGRVDGWVYNGNHNNTLTLRQVEQLATPRPAQEGAVSEQPPPPPAPANDDEEILF